MSRQDNIIIFRPIKPCKILFRMYDPGDSWRDIKTGYIACISTAGDIDITSVILENHFLGNIIRSFWFEGPLEIHTRAKSYLGSSKKYEKFIRRLSITLSSDKQSNSWWRHQMETFSALLAILLGIHRYPVISPHKGQWGGALMFYLICAWMHDWVNNREARDLRCYRAHYDVIVIHLTQVSVDIIGSTVEPAGDK